MNTAILAELARQAEDAALAKGKWLLTGGFVGVVLKYVFLLFAALTVVGVLL